MKTGFVYILKCSDGSYYTGVTNDPERRRYEHQSGLGGGIK
ncbi:GIY-YIG nuclease family protein [bacterium]|nr:GIY-YIG nuclease family protein [bacterium]